METSHDEITPLDELAPDNQKIVIFDDFVCEKNQSPLIDHFIRGHHKKMLGHLFITKQFQDPERYTITLLTFRNL